MKSPSEKNNEFDDVEKKLNTELDNEINQLSGDTLSDIAVVRQKALSKMSTGSAPLTFVERLGQWLTMPALKIGMPTAAVVIGVLLLNNNTENQIPELPIAMLTTEIPTENFILLEDLEFIIWLAENESNALL